MQKHMKDYLNELRKQQQRRRKAAIAAVLLVVLVFGMVANGLTGSGSAYTDEGGQPTGGSGTETSILSDETVVEEPATDPKPAAASVSAADDPGPDDPVFTEVSAPASDPASATASASAADSTFIVDEESDSDSEVDPVEETSGDEDSEEDNPQDEDGVYTFKVYYMNQSDEHHVELTQNFNLKYQMEFHAGGTYDVGKVVIKVPAALFNDRDGNPVLPNDSDIGVPYGTPDSSTLNSRTSFNWYLEKGENEENILVFFNYKKIQSGYNASWQVLYRGQKLMNLVNGTSWTITPTISVDGGDTPVEEEDTTLSGRINSSVHLDSVVKTYYTASGNLNYTPGLYTLNQLKQYVDADKIDSKFIDNDPEKGERLNTEKYRFVVWDVKVQGTATQPWTMSIKDIPGNGGEVVGYKDYSSSSTAYDLKIEEFDLDASGKVKPQGEYEEEPGKPVNKKESWGNRFWVVTAYPVDQVPEDERLRNDIKITLHPADGGQDVVVEAPTATWEYKGYDWTYNGDVISVTKNTGSGKYTGWLNVYRLSKEDYGDIPFTTTGRMYGYSHTHHTEADGEGNMTGDYIPNTYYTLTTTDDFMYLHSEAKNNGETSTVQMLDEKDYYFSSVTVTQTDYSYDVWEGEEKNTSELSKVDPKLLPGALKDAEGKAKSEVRIYAMLADPKGENAGKTGWIEIGTAPMRADCQMEEPYKFEADIIDQKPWRVKVEHDTIDFRTVCKIDVNVRLRRDSEKLQAVINARENVYINEESPEVRFENLSGVMGTVYEGNNVSDYLTDKIKTTSERINYESYEDKTNGTNPLVTETEKLYQVDKIDGSGKEGVLLVRDNAERIVTWLNETAGSSKSARSQNDVNNNRVLVDYYLTAYDGYEIYDKGSLNYLRQEDHQLISPGRNYVVFYDLLPYGMHFDASSPITAGRITNLNGVYKTQPRSWDNRQVTVTVDPNRDIDTNYRGTGRTMIAFHISFSGADATTYTDQKWIEGWGVSFRAYYDWKDMDRLNNIDINANLSAFMPDFSEGDARNSNIGHPALVGLKSEVDYDNGKRLKWNEETHSYDLVPTADVDRSYTDMVKDAGDGLGNIDGFNGRILDKEGNVKKDENDREMTYDDDCRNVLYAKNILKDDMATSSESKVEKLVRADADRFGTFDRTATVSAGEESFYTYDITVSTVDGIKDIVVFDRLEQAHRDRNKADKNDPFYSEFSKDGLNPWNGIFRSVDTSGLEKQEVPYTIYYSDSKEAGTTITDDGNLSADWLTEDLFIDRYKDAWQENVKAVAVKLWKEPAAETSEKPEGSSEETPPKSTDSYVLKAGESISFQIKMKAPTALENGKTRSTYNNASFSSIPSDAKDGTSQTRETVEGNSVKVTLGDPETLEIVKKTEGDVPASRLDERFEFRIHEEYEYEGKTEKNYLAYTEYKLYKLGNDEPESGVYSTDGDGYFYLYAGEKAVFEMADASRVQVKETENVFWESKTTDNPSTDENHKTRTLTVTNTYRPVLYVQKILSAIPDEVKDAGDSEFTFQINVERNGNYVPLRNAEFWYVSGVRLDGGIPDRLRADDPQPHKTNNDGEFQIKQGEVIALFPGVVGTNYQLIETDTGTNWYCEEPEARGILTVRGNSATITNYYKWKDLLLTKDITHQTKANYDEDPKAFTFRIEDADGNPVTGEKWVLLDENGKEITGTPGTEGSGSAVEDTGGTDASEVEDTTGADESEAEDTTGAGASAVEDTSETDNSEDGDTAETSEPEAGNPTVGGEPTSGRLDENGEFTCKMGFRTVKIKGLEANKKYQITEVTDKIEKEAGKPLYIPVLPKDGTMDVTMPVFSTKRDAKFTNDYQKRFLSVKKTVVKSDSGNKTESGVGGAISILRLVDNIDNTFESDDTIYYRFTATVKAPDATEGTPLTKGTIYTVTKADGKVETRRVGELDGKTPTFAEPEKGENKLGDNQFMLADGETATFEYVGMVGDEIVVTEIDNGKQVYPAQKGPYSDTLSQEADGVEASFVNGDPQSLLISKEYVGIDEIGKEAANDLNGYYWNWQNEKGLTEFVLTVEENIEGEVYTYTWPDVPVTVDCIDQYGQINTRDFEAGDPITVEPWVTIVIPIGGETGIPADAKYSLTETDTYKNRIVPYDRWEEDSSSSEFMMKTYYMQISQSAVSDALSEMKSVGTRPSATIYNEISTIGRSDDGSVRSKQMSSNSEEVPEGKKLVWRVERYDGAGWLPADEISYVILCNGKPVSQQVEYSKDGGRITLYKAKEGYPSVWFPEDKVYLNLYKGSDITGLYSNLPQGKQLLRLVEIPEESDEEWGMLIGYIGSQSGSGNQLNHSVLSQVGQSMLSQTNQSNQGVLSLLGLNISDENEQGSSGAIRDTDMSQEGGEQGSSGAIRDTDVSQEGGEQESTTVGKEYSMDVSPGAATVFVNSNSKASLEVAKYVPVESEQLFTMILEQVVSTTVSGGFITSDNYTQTIVAKRPGADIPYTIHNADGSVAGSGVTGPNGEIKLEAGQYASLEVPEGTMWLVSEKTSDSPNYTLKDLKPETGSDPRMTKLNDNLMLIHLKEAERTVKYTVEWYDAKTGEQIKEPETRSGDIGSPVSVTASDKVADGYLFAENDPRNILSTTLTSNAADNVLRLYFKELKTYTVTYTDGVNGETVFPDQSYEGLKEGDTTPAFVGTPTRRGYTFLGWTPEIESFVDSDKANEDGEIIYTARWLEIVTVTVTWVDEDGTAVLDGPKSFKKGATEPKTNVTPLKKEDGNYTYEFSGWERSEDEDGNVTYTATYTATPKTV